MGRKKSKRQAPTRKKAIEPLETQFTCPFCNHEKSCEVKIMRATKKVLMEIVISPLDSEIFIEKDKPRKTARISCRVCLEDYQTAVNILSDPLDVYNDWIDACDAAN